MSKEIIPVLTAILKDDEFLAGGVFTKEDYYIDKYNLTHEQMGNIQVCLYYALNIKNKYYNERVSNIAVNK